ncbi:uncharacterized protein DSM5745_00993 [Aspergillus mulundensis]|uniref:Uncharacterized protein n=1 Tax=Aspergillus mulundensis TaxID=1810919 RepID=A0A3D8T5G0_9EURO|nr:hypothetical protein DSM5745_00993 [Aspergillus mulundensis]RDW93671.1 hypothetical protein DSM5745_00993 [Aspergillus mulundensis]
MSSKPQYTTDTTPAERYAHYRPDQGQWEPPKDTGKARSQKPQTQQKNHLSSDAEADDELHETLDFDPIASRHTGLGAKARPGDEMEGYTITGVEDEGEQLNS